MAGVFSALSISTTNAEVKNYFQLVKSANISNMYQTSDNSHAAPLLTSCTTKWGGNLGVLSRNELGYE